MERMTEIPFAIREKKPDGQNPSLTIGQRKKQRSD